MIRAILFDVDGTLYCQKAMRRQMMSELLWFSLASPVQGASTLYVLYWFRKIREDLRIQRRDNGSIEELQYKITSEQTGMNEKKIRDIVFEWIYKKPLNHIRKFKYIGMVDFLETCLHNGIKIGVLSDYPAREKIKALGLDSYITIYLCSTDKEINAFKPSPAGITMACQMWELPSESIVYVGDRIETDGLAAEKAGTKYFHFNNNIKELKIWILKHI